MNEVPWQEKNVIFQFTKGEWRGLRIEEIRAPWDLYLEGAYLESSIGQAIHINLISDNKERVFSIRDEKREPIADIITMPVNARRFDSYWPMVRVLKTSNPMIIDNQKLIILDVIGKKEKRASDCLDLTRAFYLRHGGILDDSNPSGLILSGKKLKKWKKSWSKEYNLCIGSKAAYINVTQVQAFNFEDAISMVNENRFKEMYICVDEPWIDRLLEYFHENKSIQPSYQYHLYGDPGKTDHYIKIIRGWKNE